MAKPLIVANWKMNPQTFREAERLFFSVELGVKKSRGIEVVICPPFTWLTDFSHKYRGRIFWGAQDVFWEDKGSYTGEISPRMLKTSQVKYVIVGHSERRRFLGETDEMVNRKIKAALRAGLAPIVAIGEDYKESQEVVPPVIAAELEKALAGLSRAEAAKVAVAYEPVWAIGTGKADTPDNATRRAIYIRKLLTKMVGAKAAQGIRVLYGGSVNSRNAASFLSVDIRGMDGLLVGSASLEAGEFVKIVQSVAAGCRPIR